MNEQTAWAHLPDITATIQSVAWSENAAMYLERVPLALLDEQEIASGIWFERYQNDMDFTPWQRGRVFDEQHEVKWVWNNHTFHIVSCGQQIPPALTPFPLNAVRVEEVGYYLWGVRVKDKDRATIGLLPDKMAFVEMQIPRILRYPVTKTAMRVQVRVKEFYASNGQLCYARWCGLNEVAIPPGRRHDYEPL